MAPHTAPQQPVPLTGFKPGDCVRISFMALATADEQRIRDLGIREGCDVLVLKNAETLVIRTESSRVALRHVVGMNIFALPVRK